jgi:hypothetical protein
MRDDLIGFVLDALEPQEHEHIRRKLEEDADLRRQLEWVQRTLQPLAGVGQDVAAPPGLAARTCAQMDLLSQSTQLSQPTNPTTSLVVTAHCSKPSPVVRARQSVWGPNECDWAGEARRWTMADFVVAAGVCLAAACLFFPAVANSRWHAQMAGCQNNLRELGTSLAQYSNTAGGYFPVIPLNGNLSFSGIYAAKLAARGLMPDQRVILCPGKGSTYLLKIPPLQDIAAAQGPQLVRLHRTTGGDYAYALGYVQRGHLYGNRNQGRWNVAILSDAPLEKLRNTAIGTHGRGQNVLFEDGHVRFMTKRTRPGVPSDDMFVNDQMLVRAGLHPEDNVLAPSYVSPLPTDSDREALVQ